jgi:hypothetical protein
LLREPLIKRRGSVGCQANSRLSMTTQYHRPMNLELSDEKPAALTANITGNDRYPFSERIRRLKAILAKLRPEPVREPLPPPKLCAARLHLRPPNAADERLDLGSCFKSAKSPGGPHA